MFGGSLSDACREDLQGHGPGPREWRADHRSQRFWGRTHPGGSRQPRGIRRHLPAQHAGVRRRAAAVTRDGTVRRRCGVLARDHRLHRDGRRDELHVRHGPERGEDGDARGDRLRWPWRRAYPQRDERRRAFLGQGEPQALELARRIIGYLPQNNLDPAPRHDLVSTSARRRDARRAHPRFTEAVL